MGGFIAFMMSGRAYIDDSMIVQAQLGSAHWYSRYTILLQLENMFLGRHFTHLFGSLGEWLFNDLRELTINQKCFQFTCSTLFF